MAGLIWVIIIIIIAISADLWVPRYYGNPTAIDTTQVAKQSLAATLGRSPFRDRQAGA